MPRLIVEWSTDDPGLAAMLSSIAEFPDYSPERMELEATLHAAEAARLYREAGERRGWQRAQEAARGKPRQG